MDPNKNSADRALAMLSWVTSMGAKPEQTDDLKHNEIIAYPIVLEVPCIAHFQVEFIFKKGSLDRWLENPPDSIKMFPDHPNNPEMLTEQDESEVIGKWTEFKLVEFEFKNRILQALQAKGTFNQEGYEKLHEVKIGLRTGVSCGFGKDLIYDLDQDSVKMVKEVVAIHEISVKPHPKNALARVKKVSGLHT